jgi:UDP-3-O-[3-hydroxymyristoyl] glucosamine N-acyltransferase
MFWACLPGQGQTILRDRTSMRDKMEIMEEREPISLSLGVIAEKVGGKVKGDPEILIRGIVGLKSAGPGDLTYLTGEKHRRLLAQCRASAIIVSPDMADLSFPLLVIENVLLAYARAAQLFHQLPYLALGVHPPAHVEPNAELGGEVRIGALAHVGVRSRIGARTRIYGGAYVGNEVTLGEDCVIHPGVTILDRCLIGDRVVVNSGAVIGSDGFGYAQDERGRHVKIPQRGIVQIDEDVEIGANCTVDRAVFERTWIQKGTKIDNLVMVAHNVVVGEHCILVAQVGIAGSARLGRHVILGGQVGVVGHVEIGDGARVAGQSGVARSIKAGQDMAGSPAVPQRQWFQAHSNLRKVGRMKDELRALGERVAKLEEECQKEKP